jgi:Ca2+:H+ antiporter
VSHVVAFVLAALALAGQAWMVSLGTEQLGRRFSAGVTGVLQSTVGNLPEFFVVIFALQAGDTTVAETAILGSILVNALLVLGLVLLVGALREPGKVMKFNDRLPKDTATLLLVASFIIVLLGLTNIAGNPAVHHKETISIVGSIVILGVYAIWLRGYLTASETPGDEVERPRLGIGASLAILGAAGVGSAFVSDWFVYALEPTIHTLHISQTFAGLVIVAIAGNAVENVAGIVLAARGKADLAISVVKNSVAQIAAFLYPALVLVSLLTASRLTFAINPVLIGALAGMAILVWQITGDGEATPFEGAALVATFLILATLAAYEQ